LRLGLGCLSAGCLDGDGIALTATDLPFGQIAFRLPCGSDWVAVRLDALTAMELTLRRWICLLARLPFGCLAARIGLPFWPDALMAMELPLWRQICLSALGGGSQRAEAWQGGIL